MNNNDLQLIKVYDNLFNPINNKEYGLYWNVTKQGRKPLANAEALLKYVRKEKPEGSFISRYSNLESDLILENHIYLDFDLTKKEYLKQEESNTLKSLEELGSTELASDVKNYETLKQIQQKYKENYSIENGFIKGFNNFIDKLGVTEAKTLSDIVKDKEKEEVKGLSENEIQKYYLNKFEQDYLKEPYTEAITVAKYFESIGVKTVLNFSGSKGLHLRIPITNITFEGTDLAENPEAVKLFLKALVELIETKLLEKKIGTSSLDYQVLHKGLQRVPTSKHNKTKLYANFIEPSTNYIEAIDYLEKKVPVYLPKIIDTEENTKTLTESNIFKKAVAKAIEDSTIKTYSSEVGNIAYKFKSESFKELKENILKIYPESLNFFPYKVIHLLKRTGFSKEEVEAIFHDVEPDINEYNKNIKGNIKYAFDNPNAKICGLKNLVEWINERYPNKEKESVIDYFVKNFSYYEKPVETVLEDILLINDKEYYLTEIATSKKKYYIIKDFTAEGINLEINKEKAVIFLKHNKKILAKLPLKTKEGIALEGIVASSQDSLKKFIKRTGAKTNITKAVIEEAIEELDNYFTYLEEELEEEKEQQEQEEKLTEEIIEENNLNFRFGIAENTYYVQNEATGIEFIIEKKEDSIVQPIANLVINDVEIIINPLKLTENEKKIEPVYNITYYNKTLDKIQTSTYLTTEKLTKELIKAKVFYNSTKENVDTVLNAFIIDGTKEGRINIKEEAFLEGFYIINNKVVENTKLKNLKKYTSEDVAEAITLLNDIMKDRTEEGKANDTTVYRFMLWNPFSYCLKQIGFKAGIYSLVLIGKTKGNKTGAIKIGNLFYMNTEEETSGATVSVLGSMLGLNSFAKAFDECYNLLNQPETPDVMKKSTQDKVTRITKNKADNNEMDKFNAFALPVFLLNERYEFKDYIRERYKIREYTSKSYLTKAERKKFNEKYLPEAEDTILKNLAIIGNEFKKKIIPIIEAKDKRLFNPEELTIEILKEIAEETSEATGKTIDFLPEMYIITEDSTNYNYDVASEIINLLNNEFKKKNKVIGNEYIPRHFIESIKNNDFDFIIYNRKRTEKYSENHFLISYSGLSNFVNNHVEETVELESILEYLGLKEILKNKMKEENYKKTYEEYIRKQNYIQVEGYDKPKNIKGFYLTIEELINNLFSFNLEFTEDNE